jgi:hypothetical protein
MMTIVLTFKEYSRKWHQQRASFPSCSKLTIGQSREALRLCLGWLYVMLSVLVLNFFLLRRQAMESLNKVLGMSKWQLELRSYNRVQGLWAFGLMIAVCPCAWLLP